MRCGTEWTDVCIKNMSSRGLMAQAESPPGRGTYIEIRRGSQCIVGRVVWSNDSQFGIRAQDRIDVEAIVSEPRLAHRPQQPEGAALERRSDPRRRGRSPEQLAERNRLRAKAVQFCVMVALGGSAALFAAVQVYEVLSAPFSVAEKAMQGRTGRGGSSR